MAELGPAICLIGVALRRPGLERSELLGRQVGRGRHHAGQVDRNGASLSGIGNCRIVPPGCENESSCDSDG